ncbi:MAG TPA: alpha/beta hydrolase [Trueperaceae bacterium]
MQRESGTLTTADGLTLYTQCWLPDEAKALVVLVHGFGEHSGRYVRVAESLMERGYAVCAFDQRGHGRSEGERANLRVFRELVTDLTRFVERMRETYPGIPRFVLGHSVGALVALQFALEQPDKLDGLVVSASYIENAVEVPRLLAKLARPIGRMLPSLPVQTFDPKGLSRDPAVVRAYQNDPLVYHGKVKARMGAELLGAGPYVMTHASDITLPVLVLHGSADRVAAAQGSRDLAEMLASDDKTLIVYDGLYHEILNEPEQGKVLQDIAEWLDRHLD